MNEAVADLALFHFLRPWWLAALPLAALIPWGWRRLRRPSGDWARVCDPHLFQWLSVGQDRGGRAGVGAWLAGFALLICILALAGPSWVKLPDASFTARDSRVIVLDLSSSMLAEDLKPNRLTQVRYQLADLLASTTEGQTGLVAFAGDAFVVSPLTNDMNTIANLLPALQPDIIPAAGSRPDRGLELAATLMERAGVAAGEILLITDSAGDRAAATARSLRDSGILTSVLAVGTPEGAPIPSGGGFIKDGRGNVVIVRLDATSLREVATAGGGQYSVLSAGHQADAWASSEGREFQRREDALEERWQDAGPWLVLLVLPLLLFAFRRGLLFIVPLVVLPAMAPQTAQAAWWDDLWQRKDQQAWQALQQQQPGLAAALAQDPQIAAEGWYRAGEFQNASQNWNGIETADAHYNRGNALAAQGQLEQAIAAYDQALSIDPEMTDAIYNKNVVEQMMQEQEAQQQQQQQGEGEQQDSQDQSQDENQQGEQQEGEEQQQNQEGEEQSAAEPEAGESEDEAERLQREIQEAWSEEDAQAMEQWLRRIPDDPGGLLRRKFRNEYIKRGEPEAERESW